MINAMCNNRHGWKASDSRRYEWERIIINIMKANRVFNSPTTRQQTINIVRGKYNIRRSSGNWRNSLIDLLKFAFNLEDVRWRNVSQSERERLRNEGIIGVINEFLSDGQKSQIGGTYNRMFIYKNIITQLLRLVALLNYNVNEVCGNMVLHSSSVSSSSLPHDIGIRHNLFLNYERLKRYAIIKMKMSQTTYLDWSEKQEQSFLMFGRRGPEVEEKQIESKSREPRGKKMLALYNTQGSKTPEDSRLWIVEKLETSSDQYYLNDREDLLKHLYNFGPQATADESNSSIDFLKQLRNKNDISTALHEVDGDYRQIGGYLEKGRGESKSSGSSSGDSSVPVSLLADEFFNSDENVIAFTKADFIDPAGYKGGSEHSSSSSSSSSDGKSEGVAVLSAEIEVERTAQRAQERNRRVSDVARARKRAAAREEVKDIWVAERWRQRPHLLPDTGYQGDTGLSSQLWNSSSSSSSDDEMGSSSNKSGGKKTKKKRRRKKQTRRKRKYHKKTRKRRRKKGLTTHRKRH